MQILRTGQTAPAFVLPDADMEWVDFSNYLGRSHLVLFFYPRDGTPQGTMEAADFSDHEDDFQHCGCTIMGISRDDCIRHAEFRDRNGISVRLLSDTEGKVCKQYGVWQMKEVDGIRKYGIVRATFVIDKQGVVRFAQYGVNAKGHVKEVLRTVKDLH